MSRSLNWQLIEAFKDLPAGAFIRPVEYQYIPVHIKESLKYELQFIDNTKQVACYTRIGWFVFDRSKLRAT